MVEVLASQHREFVVLTDNDLRLKAKVHQAKRENELPPLLLIMGWTGVKEDWREFVDILSEQRDVITYDNRGSGESDCPEGPYTIEMMASDALAVLNQTMPTVEKFHVMGISMGGLIAQMLTLIAPDKVSRLILGATFLGTPSAEKNKSSIGDLSLIKDLLSGAVDTKDKKGFTRRFLEFNHSDDWVKSNPDFFDKYAEETMLYKRPLQGTMSQYQALAQCDLTKRASEITCPVLILHGSADRVIYIQQGEMIGKAIKQAKMFTLPGLGHCFWVEDPYLSAGLVARWLNMVEEEKHTKGLPLRAKL